MGDEGSRFIQMRRSASLLGVRADDDGPIATFGCDCGAVIDVVLSDANTAAEGAYEIAFTCDCLATHWVTFTIAQAP